MTVKMEWNGDDFLRRAEAAAGVAILNVGERLAENIVMAMPKGGTNDDLVTKIVRGKRRYKGSPVGGPPGSRNNVLRGSIKAQRSGPLSVRVGTNVVYARIHELGGTINHPGGTRYTFGPGGVPIFISEERAYQLALQGRFVGKTRPHPIRMPKRPFLVPGLQRYSMSKRMDKDFAKAFKGQMKAYLAGGVA